MIFIGDFRVTLGAFRLAMGALSVAIGAFRLAMGALSVAIGAFRLAIGALRLAIGAFRFMAATTFEAVCFVFTSLLAAVRFLVVLELPVSDFFAIAMSSSS